MNKKISYVVGMQHDTYGPFINYGIFHLLTLKTQNNIYTLIYTVPV